MDATLIKRAWLLREWQVRTPGGVFLVLYSGRGLGFESVSVNGVIAQRRTHIWFVPRFEFRLGILPATVDIRVRPWLRLHAARLVVGGTVLHSEGFAKGRPFEF